MNPRNEKDAKRLRDACVASRKVLGDFRANRREIVQQIAGKHHGANKVKELPLNMLALTVAIYSRQLFPKRPLALVQTPRSDLKVRGARFETALNNALEKMKFQQDMERVVLNALLSIGLVKVGITDPSTVEMGDATYPGGALYARAVDLDDWVHDMTARSWEEIAFAGNRYRKPLEWAKKNEGFDEAIRGKLTATSKHGYLEEDGQERVENIGKGDTPLDIGEYEEYVELWDLWLPKERLLVTMPMGGADVLSVLEWDGPREGPYYVLSMTELPNNTMPVPPCAHWLDLHNLVNSLMRKLGRQAEREKEVNLVLSGAEKTGEAIQKASDGDIVKSDNPDAMKKLRSGGPDQATLLFALQCKDLLSWQAGNLDSIGGLSPQAETFGAERLIAANATVQLTKMADKVFDLTHDVIRALGWWLWNDKVSRIPVTQRLRKGMVLKREFGPEDRDADYGEFDLRIDPYSMRYQSPEERLKNLMQFVQGVLPMLAPSLQQAGLMLSAEAVCKFYAKYTNMSEMDEIVSSAPAVPAAGPGQMPGVPEIPKPPVTRRIEERVSRPGASRRGADMLMANLLTQGRVQPAEAPGV